jgi:hypothetical protein
MRTMRGHRKSGEDNPQQTSANFGPARTIRLVSPGIVLASDERSDTMITCFIRYELDPYKRAQFAQYAKTWGQTIPRCGADLIGFFSPHEGSITIGYGVYNIESLAAYEAYRARLAADPMGRENVEFAQREKFILREDRMFLKNASLPHAGLIQP